MDSMKGSSPPVLRKRRPRGAMFARMPLRAKLTVLFLAAALLPLGVLAIVNYASNRAILVKTANDGLFAAASLTAGELDSYFSQKLAMTAAEARLSNVVRYLELSARGEMDQAEFREMQDFIRSLAFQDSGYLRAISLIGSRGRTLADINLSKVGEDRSGDVCFKEALTTGLRYVSPILFDRQTGAAYFCVAAPARDADGNILGVWSKRYSADAIQFIAAKNAGLAGADSYPMVFERKYRLRLADGRGRSELYKTTVPMSVEVNFDLRGRNLIPRGAPDELSSGLADFEAGLLRADAQPLFATKTRPGDTTIHQAAVASMTAQPWVVVFVQPRKSFLKPIAEQTRFSLAVMLLIALAVTGFGLYVSKNVADPVLRLTETAEAIHAGDLSALAEVESQDEIGKLAIAFNDMTLQLRAFIDSLEQRVAERAAALEKARAESEAARADLEEQIWLANGQTGLADAIRGEQTVAGLAKKALAMLCPYMSAQAGALFLLENDGKLALVGTCSYTGREGFNGFFELGEGLVGQAAADGKIMYADISSDALVISTGLGDILARKVVALPFFINDKTVGVAELATLADFQPKHLELWSRVSEPLGYAFYAVRTRQSLALLLQESQRQAEELQAREEELRAANEELQAQAENLKAVRRYKAQKDKAE